MIDKDLHIVDALAAALEAAAGDSGVPRSLTEAHDGICAQGERILSNPDVLKTSAANGSAVKNALAVALLVRGTPAADKLAERPLGADKVEGKDLNRPIKDFLKSDGANGADHALGSALRQANQPDAAAAVYLSALARKPDDLESLRSLSAILRDRKRLDAALVLAGHAVELHPDNAWTHIQQGNVLARMDKADQAIAAYRRALEIDPGVAGVRSALARQLAQTGDFQGAASNYLRAIEQDSKDRRSIEALAAMFADAGRHAESIIWWRRALDLRPNSKTLKRRLANALLLREHWQAGWQLLGELDATDRSETWDGTPLPGRRLVFAHQPGEPALETLFGLGLASALASSGQPAVCVCPASLAALISAPPTLLTVLDSEKQSVTELLDGDDFGAYAPLGAVTRLHRPPPPLTPWLHPPDFRQSTQIETIAFILGAPPRDGWPGLDHIRTQVADNYDIRAVYTRARPTIEKAVAVMKTADLVITDDPLSAACAAAVGRASIFVLPRPAEWWWGDRGKSSPWAANQTLIRVGPDDEPADVWPHVADAIARSALQDPGPAPRHPEGGPQELAEMLDVVSPLLDAAGTEPRLAEPLAGGTRNSVFRLHDDGGDRVLRLGRFPNPRDGFYAKEIANMRIAAEAGLSPRIDYTNPLDGSMLIEYLDGETMSNSTLREADNALAVARLFRRLHQLPGFKDRFDIFEKIERNVRRLEEDGAEPFLSESTYNDLARRLIAILRDNRVPHYATHNDPLSRNFVRRGDRMYVIDWECSGLGDPHWEVAALSAQAGLKGDVWTQYVSTYFGSETHPGRCRIPLYEALCWYFWWTDALRSALARPDDAERREKAERWLKLFTGIIGRETFADAVKDAEGYRWKASHSPAAGTA